MLAKHWRLLSVFAGGCLSGALVIVGFRDGTEPNVANIRRTEPPSVTTPGTDGEDGISNAAPSPHVAVPEAPKAEGSATAVAAATHPADLQEAEHGAEPAGTDAGRSVADVLLHLEAAYRQKLADVAAPAPAAPPAEATPSTTSVAAASAPAAPEREAAPTAPAGTVVTQAPAAAVVPVAAPVLTAAPSLHPAPAAEPASVSMVATRAPAPAAANPLVATLPAVGAVPQVGAVSQVGVVPQNVHVGDTHYGNTYQVQQIIQYVPMYAPWPYGAYGGGYVPPAHGRSNQPKRVPYPSTLTNPDNPWGFDFPNALWTVR